MDRGGLRHVKTYDGAGHELSETLTDGTDRVTPKAMVYDLDGNVTALTDANGNQVSKSVTPAGGTATETDFTYTSRDRLAEVTTGGTVAASFDYDDAGRRIRKNSASEGSSFAVWDGRSLVAETDVATGGVLRSYTHGLDLIRENVLGQTAEAYTDVLGSVGALLPEGKPAGMAAQFRYDAFGGFRTQAHPGGDCSSQPNSLACNAPLTYTGHLYDPETGLFYFGARYYDPETGRFLTHDPVAGDALNPPSLHRYLYAYSSPMTFTDAWGETGEPSGDYISNYEEQFRKTHIFLPGTKKQAGQWVSRKAIEADPAQYLQSLVNNSGMSPSQAVNYLSQRNIGLSVVGGGAGSMFALQTGTALAEKPVNVMGGATIGVEEFVMGGEACVLLEDGTVIAVGAAGEKLQVGARIMARVIRYGARPAANAITGTLYDLAQDTQSESGVQSPGHYANRFLLWFTVSQAFNAAPAALDALSSAKSKAAEKIGTAVERLKSFFGEGNAADEVIGTNERGKSLGAAKAGGPEFAGPDAESIASARNAISKLKGLGLDPAARRQVIEAINNGEPVVIIGEGMGRVNKVSSALADLGVEVRTYSARKWYGGVNRLNMESNRAWLGYWTKEKGALIVDIGNEMDRVLPPSPYYGMESKSLEKWGYKRIVHATPGF